MADYKGTWGELTDAKVVTMEVLMQQKRESNAVFVGVAGFSRALTPPEAASARKALEQVLDEQVARHAPRPVWMVSGGTTGGAVGVAYEVAGEKGLVRVGLTAEEARKYGIAAQEWVVVGGEGFGDESPLFVGCIDALVLVGGGAQSTREAGMVREAGKPVVLVTGMGGAAEELGWHEGGGVEVVRV